MDGGANADAWTYGRSISSRQHNHEPPTIEQINARARMLPTIIKAEIKQALANGE